jgi:hypothetical protein
VMTDKPTTSATWAGVRGLSARKSSQMACHGVFSTGWRLARYSARAWFAVRCRSSGSRFIGFPPTGLYPHSRDSDQFGMTLRTLFRRGASVAAAAILDADLIDRPMPHDVPAEVQN